MATLTEPMTLTITIQMDNEVFEPPNGNEAARILHALAGGMEQEDLDAGYSCPLRDYNGNTVGKAEVTA